MICVMNSSLKIVWKTKITFLLSETLLFFLEKKYILFLETYFFSDSWEFNYFSIFYVEADTKKHRYASAKASNATLVKLTDWIIKNDHVIFCKRFNMAKQAMLFDSPQHGFNLSAGGCK